MKKSHLYKLIKSTVKEQWLKRKKLKKQVLGEQRRERDIPQDANTLTPNQRKHFTQRYQTADKNEFPNLKSFIDSEIKKLQQGGAAGLDAFTGDKTADPNVFNPSTDDGGGGDPPASNATDAVACGAEVNYGSIRLFNGDCGDEGIVSFEIFDGFICCGSENYDDGGGDPWNYVGALWPIEGDAIDSMNGLELGGGGVQSSCYCPTPVYNADQELMHCFGGGNNSFTQADVSSYLSQNGFSGLGDSAVTSFPDPVTGTGHNNGNHCAGCYHSDASNDGDRLDGTGNAGTGTSNTLFGCPNGTTYPTSATGRDNMSCCDFTLNCATSTVTGYDDGNDVWPGGSFDATNGTAITLTADNQSSVTSQGPSPQTVAWNTAGAFNQITDNYGCTFPGCDNDAASGNLATNYTTVIYGGQPNTGAAVITDDGSCVTSTAGCTNSAACNYSAAANTDDGSCEYYTCAGCMDNGTSNLGTNRPASGFTGAACNYSADNTISNPDDCEYTSCVGCMDNGTTNPGTDRPTTNNWLNQSACNFLPAYTNHDADACEYESCVGCKGEHACNYDEDATVAAEANSTNDCDYSCYGCTQTGMNGDGTNAYTAYSAVHTINNTILNGEPNDPAVNPCVYTGCLTKEDSDGYGYANYVCTVNWELCTVGGGVCGSSCPLGDYDTSLGSFVDGGNCTSTQVPGCTTPGDCEYDSIANTDDGSCTGVPGFCEACLDDGTGTGTTAPGPDPSCGCTNTSACNYDSTASQNDGSCIVPAHVCERCNANDTAIEANPECEGCLSTAACNFGYDVNDNYDPDGPIVTCWGGSQNAIFSISSGWIGDSTWGNDYNPNATIGGLGCPPSISVFGISWPEEGGGWNNTGCVYPGSNTLTTTFFATSAQQWNTYNNSTGADPCDQCDGPALSATPWPGCDGCANPDACNYDSSASDVNDPSCLVPDDCNSCDPNDPNINNPALYTYPLIPNPDCACAEVWAVDCNSQLNSLQFKCMTIDGEADPQTLMGMYFEVELDAKSKKTEESINENDGEIKEVLTLVASPPSKDKLEEQPWVQGPPTTALAGGNVGTAKVKKVYEVTMAYEGSGTAVDYPESECKPENYKCWCFANNHNTSGGGWPGHPHGCLKTDEAANGFTVFSSKGACDEKCYDTQTADCPDHTDANGNDNSDDFCDEVEVQECEYGCLNPMDMWGPDSWANGGGWGYGKCCDQDFQGLPIANHADSCCLNNTYGGSGGGGGGTGGGGGGGGGGGTGGGGASCFTGETLITMEDGSTKRIDEVELEDIVKSEKESSKVIGIDIHKGTFTVYSINGSKAFTTAEHPFKTTEGWKAIDPLETLKKHKVESTTLKIGDILVTKEGTEEVKSIEASTKTVDIVYNLSLNNEHVYYAGEYLVHNLKTADDDRFDDPFEDGPPIDENFGGIKEVKDSQKLRNLFKQELLDSKKVKKEAKLRESIRKIIKNKLSKNK